MRVTPERRATGTDPVSLLPQKAKVVRLERLPNEAGIEPVKLLPLMFKVVRAVRLPSEAGKEPDTRRFLFPTSMPVILPLVTVIPGQSFIFVQVGPLPPLYQSSQFCPSEGFRTHVHQNASRLMQSSTRSLFAPSTLGWVAVST